MHHSRRTLIGATLAALFAVFSAGPAMAQAYPERPVKLVIPYAPGGPTDVLGRVVAEHLGRVLKQPVVTENRPGAGGVIAMAEVSRAAPDGYTLLLGDINLSVSPSMHKTLAFDPVRSFTPIGMIATAPMVVLVPGTSPIKSIKELVDQAKNAPGTLSYAHAGVGSPTHLGPEVLKSRYNVDLISVPYKSSGEALTALAAGHAQVVFTGMSAARGLMDAGKVRPLAIAGTKRSPVLPDLPTMAEAGVPVPEIDVGSWWGLLAPAGLPAGITSQLNTALHAALASPELSQRLAAMNFTQGQGTPQDLQAWIASETRTWSAVMQRAGIRPE